MIIPAEARPLVDALAPVFTQPTFHRFVVLLGSAILTTGRRTVANLARTAAPPWMARRGCDGGPAGASTVGARRSGAATTGGGMLVRTLAEHFESRQDETRYRGAVRGV